MNVYVWNNVTGQQIVIIAETPAIAVEILKQTSLPLYGEVQQFKQFDDLPVDQIIAIRTDGNMTQDQKTAAFIQLLSDTYVDPNTGFTSKAVLPTEYTTNSEEIFISP